GDAAPPGRSGRGAPGPPPVLGALSRLPGFPRLAGRRNRVDVPAPVPVIAAGAPWVGGFPDTVASLVWIVSVAPRLVDQASSGASSAACSRRSDSSSVLGAATRSAGPVR